MKATVLTGSNTFLQQERNPTWQLTSPYMAAIIRRQRFLIILVICILLLTIFNWHFHRKENTTLNINSISYINENGIDDIRLFEPNEKYISGITKGVQNIKTDRQQLESIKKYFNIADKYPLQMENEKKYTKYQVEEFRHFIYEQEELRTNALQLLDENIVNKDDETHTIPSTQPPEFFNSSKVPMVTEKKYLDFNKSALNQRLEKEAALFPLEHLLPSPSVDEPIVKNNDKKTLPKQRKLLPNEYSTDKNIVLLIDTPGCKIPKLDPWDPLVEPLIELQDPYECPGPPVFMKSNPGGLITLNKTILESYYNTTPEELICYYQPINRIHEEKKKRERSILFGYPHRLEFEKPFDEDYITATCKIHGKRYEQYFPLVRLKENVEKERNFLVPPNPKLNVILIGIDSVSKLNFLRHFPRTHAFLNETLKAFEMNGYTKVADNTFPNLVPLLTGRFVEYWWNETLKNTMFFDDVDFIWKEYAKRGYRTFFAEDSPFIGTFNYFKRGFYEPPTDYYFRPLALALERWKILAGQEKEFCLNSEIDFDFIFDYLKVFTQTMEERPYFGFTMVSTITHDYLNYAGWADEPTERLLDGLLTSGSLNNSLLVLFSDHGLRFGQICRTYVGQFEERLPLMYVHVPKWFLEQHPEIEKNMLINQNRLMTLFDIHATMLHLLNLNTTHSARSTRTLGQSLFEEISSNRTCADAHIDEHWCPCQLFVNTSVHIPEVVHSSQAIVKDINSKLEPYSGVCELLELNNTMEARVGKANKLHHLNRSVNDTGHINDVVTSIEDFMITIDTKPGGGVFEGTVRHTFADNSYKVLGVNRISMYGNTSWCIDSQKLKVFCYCKNLQMK